MPVGERAQRNASSAPAGAPNRNVWRASSILGSRPQASFPCRFAAKTRSHAPNFHVPTRVAAISWRSALKASLLRDFIPMGLVPGPGIPALRRRPAAGPACPAVARRADGRCQRAKPGGLPLLRSLRLRHHRALRAGQHLPAVPAAAHAAVQFDLGRRSVITAIGPRAWPAHRHRDRSCGCPR